MCILLINLPLILLIGSCGNLMALENSATEIGDTTVQFFINFLVLKELISSNIIQSDGKSFT